MCLPPFTSPFTVDITIMWIIIVAIAVDFPILFPSSGFTYSMYLLRPRLSKQLQKQDREVSILRSLKQQQAQCQAFPRKWPEKRDARVSPGCRPVFLITALCGSGAREVMVGTCVNI